jgi:hypothetical protein
MTTPHVAAFGQEARGFGFKRGTIKRFEVSSVTDLNR